MAAVTDTATQAPPAEPDAAAAPAEPVSRCGACGQIDDHPKHQIAIGVNVNDQGVRFYHEHDHAREGCIYYHFDCDSEWHDLHSILSTEPVIDEEDPTRSWLQPQADEHRAVADRHAATVEACKGGLKGEELRQWIKAHGVGAGGVRGGAGGIDQTMATGVLAALSPNSGTKTIGTITVTGPIKERIMTANGSDTAAGTELATSGGYTAGGTSVSMGTAASGSVTSNGAASWTNMPATTSTGQEQWDSSASPLRTFWSPWSGGNISIASGNTFTVPSGSLTDTLA